MNDKTLRRCSTTPQLAVALILSVLGAGVAGTMDAAQALADPRDYEREGTRELVALVNDAAKLVEARGEAAFAEFRTPNSRWRREETYIFVLDRDGKMWVHLDPTMEGKNQIGLKDVNGRPIIRGLLDAATAVPDRPEGWYHYEWPAPGGLLPRWKSSYVRLVTDPSGKRFVVGSGIYDDRMERAFVVEIVDDAVARIEKQGRSAFALFRDRTGPSRAKNAYVFVIDPTGRDLVNPAFPNLEGRNMLEVKDAQGKALIREMLGVVQKRGAGWVDYMWPKPGESVSTQKSTYVRRANIGGQWVLVGCGVYLADAPRTPADPHEMTASQLMALVREGAAVLEQRGEQAYPEFRTKGSKWLRDDTYFFVWGLDGKRAFHAVDPSLEGKNASSVTDALGRPYGKMILEAARSGEGWVHYMYPEPGNLFPTWKSTFVKRVRFPSGQEQLVGAGVYNMRMDEAFIEDVVNRAAKLVEEKGQRVFDTLRDKKGPFVFMDTYVFVNTPDGMELVNSAQPSLEGRNLIDQRDVKGKPLVRDYIEVASRRGSGWVDYYWYRPGHDEPVRKKAFVRKVQSGKQSYIVGSGFYVE